MDDSVIKRFWNKVEINDKNKCWFYLGFKDKDGYGRFKVNGKSIRANRFSYSLTKVLTDAMVVRHSCDTPSCVNPNHLIAGTQKENIQDKVKRERCAKGEKHSHAILSEAQVKEIKQRLDVSDKKRGFCQDIAKDYGVSANLVSCINTGRIWRGIHPLQ